MDFFYLFYETLVKNGMKSAENETTRPVLTSVRLRTELKKNGIIALKSERSGGKRRSGVTEMLNENIVK